MEEGNKVEEENFIKLPKPDKESETSIYFSILDRNPIKP
jgi:hypothetical protein